MSVRESDSSRRSRIKTMSVSVKRLQDALNMHLDIQEKTEFVDILNEFHITRDVPIFVKHLKQLLDTPAKKQIFPLVGKVIPQSEKELFDQCLKLDGRKFGTMPSKPKRKSKLPRKDELLKAFQIKPKSKSDQVNIKKDKESEGSQSIREKNSTKSIRSQKSVTNIAKDSGSEVRRILIKQSGDPDQGFGFSIRGGSEYGIGIYVSMVDEGGMAEKQGLLPGDLLMEVNDVTFNKISHSEAAKVIRAARKLDITLCHVGRIPGSFVVHQMYRWVDPVGRTVSPPPELDRLGQTDSVGRKSGFSLLKDIDERKVNVVVEDGQRLGLMIRGGREFGLGIYISGVDQFSTAEEAGLKVGDQILDVNGESFLDITHAEAVRVLKMSKHLVFTIKDIGKLPFGRTKVDRTNWWNHRSPTQSQRAGSQRSGSTLSYQQTKSVFSKGIGSQLMYNSAVNTKWDMIENQARELLNNTEQGTLRYYLSEYQKGYITVDGLLLASFELLNTKAKMTLLDEIRNLVQAQDLEKFDTLRERREMRQRQGFLPETFSSLSLDSQTDKHTHRQRPRSAGSAQTSRSEPFTRSQQARDLSGRQRKVHTASNLDSLRQAIEQIEDDSDWAPEVHAQNKFSKNKLLSSRMRSLSNEHLPSYRHNPPSLMSNRSLSVEALTPLSVETSFNKQASNHRRSRKYSSRTPELKIATGTKISRDEFQRPRSNSNPSRRERLPVPDSVAHRQRTASVSSSIQRPYKAVSSERPQKPRRTNISPRVSSDDEVKARSPNESVKLLKHIPGYQSPRPVHRRNENIVYAEVHQQPRVAKDSPSDDSGVEVNGQYDTHQMDRVTISRETPVDIDDVLERRSSVIDTSVDDHHGNSLQAISGHPQNHQTDASFPHSPRSQRNFSMPPLRNYPPEIRLNDGEGSIDTMSFDTVPSPKFINQPESSLNRLSYFNQSYSRIHDDGDDDDSSLAESRVDDEEPQMYDIHSENGDDMDFYVSPLDKVLDDEDSDLDSKKIVDAKKKYGDIPLEIIPIYKTKPTLGMAIEGGANTRQPLPRVISIQPGGSAYESGGLKVGHVILEVNSESLVGLEHIAAAKAIAESFKDKSNDQMDLLVTEADVVLKKQKTQEFQV